MLVAGFSLALCWRVGANAAGRRQTPDDDRRRTSRRGIAAAPTSTTPTSSKDIDVRQARLEPARCRRVYPQRRLAPKGRAAPKAIRERRRAWSATTNRTARPPCRSSSRCHAVLGYADRRRHEGDPAEHADDVGAAGGEDSPMAAAAAILRHRLGGDHRARRRPRSGTRPRSKPASIRPGAEQARHVLEQVGTAERAIFADPAERLQCDSTGHRAGARYRRPSGAELRDRPVGQARTSPTPAPASSPARPCPPPTTNGCARSAPSRSCSTASPSRARSARPRRRHQQELHRGFQAAAGKHS